MFNIPQFYVLPPQCICMFCMDLRTNQLFLYTALTDWFLYQSFKPLQPSGSYIYHQFNIQQFYILPTQCIYMFCTDLRTNQLFLYTALTDWFLYQSFKPLQPSGSYMYHQFNIQ